MQQSDLFPDELLQKLKAGKAVVVSVRSSRLIFYNIRYGDP